MTIRDLCEADPWIVALCIQIRKGGTKLQKEYRIGSGVEKNIYWQYLGESKKWIQYQEPGFHVPGCYGDAAVSVRPINYHDEERTKCGVILQNIPKRLLDLEIAGLRHSSGLFFHRLPGDSDCYGYTIDAFLPEGMERWKDLSEEKTKDPDLDEHEEYITEDDLLKPKEENITFDDLLKGEET